MSKVAIAFSTKDRIELSRRTVVPLLQPDKFDLFWIDGSDTLEGQELPEDYSQGMFVRSGIRGGADAAIVYALTTMLADPQYDAVGLVENDVLLAPDWFDRTMALFERGRQDGLEVGAVSARCYQDRILIQRDGYAVCHNLGAGHVIFTREAARLVLDYFRTGWTMENRRVFMQVSGLDIGAWWAFRGGQHFTTADWRFDVVLAAHGLASLALTPSTVEMIGQDPPLEEQGLVIADGPVEVLRDDAAFHRFAYRTRQIREGEWGVELLDGYHADDGSVTLFPHQFVRLGATWGGDWRLRWCQGFGPFAWRAGEAFAELEIPVSGSCSFTISGGKDGGRVRVIDVSGFDHVFDLPPEGEQGQAMTVVVPAAVLYRNVYVMALTPGVTIYGMQVREAQPGLFLSFDHSYLPPV